ncbi:MAG TPA: phage shock protein A [Candidatus Latescibacteria bacterium]|jgi:phage shock protein A|nr:phage shock protein A [Candidatus Latescibacterota bacterium]
MAKGMFARMTDILRSNLNEALDRAEDPEKLIRQMIREMEEAVNKATASVGTAVANQKRLERQHDERANQAQDWQRKAERAVEADEDELARRALERKTVLQRTVEELAPAVEESRKTAQQLREQLRELKGKLEEARTRQGTLMARHRAAEARKKLAKSLHGLGDDAFSSFERFEQRVEESEAVAEAHAEVASDIDDVERRVRDLDRGASVEEELRALKDRLLSERAASQSTGA